MAGWLALMAFVTTSMNFLVVCWGNWLFYLTGLLSLGHDGSSKSEDICEKLIYNSILRDRHSNPDSHSCEPGALSPSYHAILFVATWYRDDPLFCRMVIQPWLGLYSKRLMQSSFHGTWITRKEKPSAGEIQSVFLTHIWPVYLAQILFIFRHILLPSPWPYFI